MTCKVVIGTGYKSTAMAEILSCSVSLLLYISVYIGLLAFTQICCFIHDAVSLSSGKSKLLEQSYLITIEVIPEWAKRYESTRPMLYKGSIDQLSRAFVVGLHTSTQHSRSQHKDCSLCYPRRLIFHEMSQARVSR